MGKLTAADKVFYKNIKSIMQNGYIPLQTRPKYKDGTTALSRYNLAVMNSYDLNNGDFPITTLRPIAIKSAIKEMMWIYKEQSNDLSLLKEKYGVHYWDEWNIGDGTIGIRYGETVRRHNIMNKLLEGLEENPYNRRNIINLWQYEDFESSEGLPPCAFLSMFEVRNIEGKNYLDLSLIQRSNDMLVAHHINAMQYVALQMMVACHFGWEVGQFHYFCNNLHIYDNQFEQAEELISRYKKAKLEDEKSEVGLEEFDKPRLVLNRKLGTNFFDIQPDDFEMQNYNPIKPNLKFNLAI